LADKEPDPAPAPEKRERRERKVEPKAEPAKPQPPAEEEPPTRRQRREEAPASTGDCPHEHKFGVDFEKFDICDKCVKWDDCYADSKRLKKLQA
jgi:hypothetical protein